MADDTSQYYTSQYSGTQIDEAVFFGDKAKDIGKTVVSQDVHEGDWTRTDTSYTYTYPSTPSANAFSHLPLVFFVTNDKDGNRDRIDLDYKVSADLTTITVSSNKNLALTMVICG